MKDPANYEAAWSAACWIICLLGLGKILDENPETSWMTTPIMFVVVGLIGFMAASIFPRKRGE